MALSLSTAQADTGSSWDLRKDTIYRLYILENMTLKEVMSTMATEHGHFATKSQYESHIKKWSFSKNLKSVDYVGLNHQILKRKRAGKESEVHIHGKLVPMKKIRKEISRNCRASQVGIYAPGSAPSPKPAYGVEIRTPISIYPPFYDFSGLSYFHFENFLSSQVDWLSISRANETHLRGSALAISVSQTQFVGDFLSCVWAPNFISSSMPRMDSENRTEVSELNQHFASVLRPIMPHEAFKSGLNAWRKMALRQNEALPQFITLTLSLLSNNLLRSNVKKGQKILTFLKSLGGFRALQSLILAKGMMFEALAEQLFRLSIEEQDVETLRALLGMGFDPNEQVCHRRYGEKRLALQRVSEQGHLAMARLLIEAGADVNKVHVTSKAYETPLQIAVEWKHVDLVRYLLAHGADVNRGSREGGSPIISAATFLSSELLELLLEYGADPNSEDEWRGNSLRCALDAYYHRFERLEVEEIIRIVRSLLGTGATINGNISPSVLDLAVRSRSVEILDLLLSKGAKTSGHLLCQAAEIDEVEMVKRLLEAKTNLICDDCDVCDVCDVSPLSWAVEAESAEIVKLLLDAGVNPNPSYESNTEWRPKTPLQEALFVDEQEIALMLLAYGADVNAPRSAPGPQRIYDYGVNSLEAAAASGSMKMVEVILKAGASIQCAQYALSYAAASTNDGVVSLLLEAGAEVNTPARGFRGRTALQAAVECSSIAVISALLKAGADVDEPPAEERGTTALNAAIERRDAGILRLILEAGPDINNPFAKLYGRTALESAVIVRDTILVRRLLCSGASPNDPQALLAAVQGDTGRDYFHGLLRKCRPNLELLQLLLKQRQRLPGRGGKQYGCLALVAAISGKEIEVVRLLLDAGIDVNTAAQRSHTQGPKASPYYGETALGMAIRTDGEQGFQLVSLLLRSGANPNCMCGSNMTPLTMAMGLGKIAVAQLLIDAGADVRDTTIGWNRRTPLQAAAGEGVLPIVQSLLVRGAEVNTGPAEDGGATALQAAAIGGYFEIASYLIDKGADVNALPARENGRTALEGAAEHGRIDMVRILLDAGAQLHGEGETQYSRACNFAAENGYHAVRNFLQEKYSQGCRSKEQEDGTENHAYCDGLSSPPQPDWLSNSDSWWLQEFSGSAPHGANGSFDTT